MTPTREQRTLYLLGPGQVELRREPTPAPGAGELLIRVDAATTCGTDLKVFRRGGHPRMLRTPCPFGHEVTGTVVARGAAVNGWREGDEVVIANSAACGHCPPCRAGRENLCLRLTYLNGAFADYLRVPELFVHRSTYRRPGSLAPSLAALAEPLACVLHGLEQGAGPQPPGEALVLGAGPIGLMFVAELARSGCRVAVADRVPERLAVGRRLGAVETLEIAADGSDPDRLHDALAGGGAPLVVDATGHPEVWAPAFRAVAPGGTLVLYGGHPPDTEVTLDSHRLHYGEITVRGVYHHRPATFAAALDRLSNDAADLAILISETHGLEGVATALAGMAERRILKAAILPHGHA